jgi:hypothetical protein
MTETKCYLASASLSHGILLDLSRSCSRHPVKAQAEPVVTMPMGTPMRAASRASPAVYSKNATGPRWIV